MFLLRKGNKNANPANRQTSSRGKTSPGKKTSLKINKLPPQRRNRMPLHNKYVSCPWPNKESINCPRNNQHKNANLNNLIRTLNTLNSSIVNQRQREKQKRRIAQIALSQDNDPNKLYKLQA